MGIFGFLYRVRNLPNRSRGWKQELQRIAQLGFLSELSIVVTRADGTKENLGVVSRRIVTDVGIQKVVDAFQGLFTLSTFNYHDSGVNALGELVSDTALGSPAGPARVAGVQSEPAANQYRTVATITYATTQTITEHGIFSAATAGSLWDRSLFTGIPVNNLDQVQFTYTLTVISGG